MKKIISIISILFLVVTSYSEELEGIITGVKDCTGTTTVGSGKTLQIGNIDTEGTLNIAVNGANFVNSGKLIISEKGTLNITNTSTPYSSVGRLGVVDIYGTIKISGGSFWSGSPINIYGNAKISGSFSMGYGAIMNVNTANADFTGVEFRVDQGKSTTSQLILNAVNAVDTMGSIKLVYWSGAGSNLRIKVGDYENVIPKLRFNKDAALTLDLLGDKTLSIKKICFDKDMVDANLDTSNAIASFTIKNFDNGKIFLTDVSGISIENNILKAYKDSSTTLYSYIDIIAYDGSGNLIEGDWSFVETEGGCWLNNSAIPEPSVYALILGVMGFFVVVRRSRK